MRLNRLCCVFSVCLLAISSTYAQQKPQPKIDTAEQGRLHDMLREISKAVKKNYYDPTLHGIDIDARYKEYDARLAKAAMPSAAYREVAAFLSAFHDSHLYFVPPSRNLRFDAGYRMEMVGDRCFVTLVKPKTDAAGKLHAGDEVAHFQGYSISRADFHEMDYYFHNLAPVPVEQLDIFAPNGDRRTVDVKSKIREGKRTLVTGDDQENDVWDEIREGERDSKRFDERIIETEPVMYWKMAEFRADNTTIDAIFDKARNHPALILDLRDNGGGSVSTLERVVGHFFNHDVKIAERVSRKPEKPMLAKASSKPYTGKVIVLINSRSASASELLARVLQLEHRGTVIGDISAGAVMQARYTEDTVGLDTKIIYGMSITDANLLMADGKSIENIGVIPDEKLLPSANDMAINLDPVMAAAAKSVDVKLTPAEAGKLFPYIWGEL